MNLNQISRLVATVPDTIDSRQRSRLRAHEDMATECELQIRQLREDLERSFQRPAEPGEAASPDGSARPNTPLATACQLDALERVQPRVDAWLVDYVASLVSVSPPVDYGDGQPV